jgi:hypothetical protein
LDLVDDISGLAINGIFNNRGLSFTIVFVIAPVILDFPLNVNEKYSKEIKSLRC